MDQFEDTVVNPNISLKNFEVKIREPNKNQSTSNKQDTSSYVSPKKHSVASSIKGVFLLMLLLSIFIYQISPYL